MDFKHFACVLGAMLLLGGIAAADATLDAKAMLTRATEFTAGASYVATEKKEEYVMLIYRRVNPDGTTLRRLETSIPNSDVKDISIFNKSGQYSIINGQVIRRFDGTPEVSEEELEEAKAAAAKMERTVTVREEADSYVITETILPVGFATEYHIDKQTWFIFATKAYKPDGSVWMAQVFDEFELRDDLSDDLFTIPAGSTIVTPSDSKSDIAAMAAATRQTTQDMTVYTRETTPNTILTFIKLLSLLCVIGLLAVGTVAWINKRRK